MKKTYFIDFISNMCVKAEDKQKAEEIFWDKMFDISREYGTELCWTEISCIEENDNVE